eukprot:CAMPEP_0113684470 /NCGR_PEP_ID=MMETSP0038_2-20120614/14023_1 /TAXON_ID=2898 /ORGANISM="Cryptomonas paramecium" /LENGTH=963 /DNA_ID=CAMNT_0000604227 /DNA_START=13 /DNA_END=2904 /DNA_ORIENTATION=- /assembly_acc=CAM_ASM_000170
MSTPECELWGVDQDDDEVIEALFHEMDTDHNGTITKDEVEDFFNSQSLSAESISPVMIPAIQRHRREVDEFKELQQALASFMDAARPMTLETFKAIARKVPRLRGQRVHWAKSLGLEKLLARLLPLGTFFDGLQGLRDLEGDQIEERVRDVCSQFRDVLHGALVASIKRLRDPSASAADFVNSKFSLDDAFEGRFADLGMFYDGPERVIGVPNPNALEGIKREHCDRSNANTVFVSPNYNFEFIPRQEHEFVVRPDRSVLYPHTPKEPSKWREDKVSVWKGNHGREIVYLEAFMEQDVVRRSGLKEAEVVSIRLYTGPMYSLYNAVLRQHPESTVTKLDGNKYETTLFCIISGVTKLSRTTVIPDNRLVFRGLGGMILPKKFWKSEDGFRGGVEMGFMSTTTDRSVAMQYSGALQNRGTVFEIAAGRIDAGADISWASQYADEREFLFPPLCCLEVVDEPHVTDDVVVFSLRVNINLKCLTLEQLEERRKGLHLAMLQNLREELAVDCKICIEEFSSEKRKSAKTALASHSYLENVDCILEEFKGVESKHKSVGSDVFNNDDEYKRLLSEALEAKAGLIEKQQSIMKLSLAGAKDFQLKRFDMVPHSDCMITCSLPNNIQWDDVLVDPCKLDSLDVRLELSCGHAACVFDAAFGNPRYKSVRIWKSDSRGPDHSLPVTGLQTKFKLDHSLSITGLQTKLELRACGLHHEVYGSVAAGIVLAAGSSLTCLDLTGASFSQQHSQVICHSIAWGCLKLERLNNLRVAANKTDNLHLMVSRGSRRSWLRSACLSQPESEFQLDELDGFEWTFVLTKLRQAQTNRLDLSDHITKHGCLLASQNFWAISTLETLNCAKQGLGPDGTVRLSQSLRWLVNLKSLNLSNNEVGAEGCLTLSSALGCLTALTQLDLSNNRVGAEGCLTLSSALGCLTALTQLDLSKNRFGAEGCLTLSSALGCLTALTQLDLR